MKKNGEREYEVDDISSVKFDLVENGSEVYLTLSGLKEDDDTVFTFLKDEVKMSGQLLSRGVSTLTMDNGRETLSIDFIID